MAKIKTQNSSVYAATDDTTVDEIGCVTNVSGLGGARSQIDVSCWNSDENEFEGGRANPGQVTIGTIYDTGDAIFDAMVALKESGDVVDWFIAGNDGTDPPTIVATVFTPPTTRTGIYFRGYVADITWDMADNSVWKNQIVVQRSGGWTLSKKTP